MSRRPGGPEHIEAAQDYLAQMDKASKSDDWEQVTAAAQAARAHIAMAELARALTFTPLPNLGPRDVRSWQTSAGADQ